MEHHGSTFQGLPRPAPGDTDLGEVDIHDINKVLLLRVLYNNARLVTPISRPFDFDLARQVMATPILTTDLPDVRSWLSISTFCGRVIGVAFTRTTAQGWIYDQLNGAGAFEHAVHRARQLTGESARWLGGAVPDRERELEGTPPPPYREREN
ncbi:hypothetical protein ASPACDRAFT_60015 [Aspergillus aculeatus ATCC 16872]|uniref:Uncharacterized protein n=1 Tax=Aspergillus aculeatus (strain ATCC 16872 / CBS 172.66 / WB 5094) TaxID=690307 RepID=A0A1L9WVK8_ASPA1|nr:uncharacterized protein ASPACDRAFT_60015 [Aspergillus aculeatus ATCC 16872]OJK00163.1 hypothetical protein ASPACDRAFT_60015 [Aspergillus aculeatus ATCC 16872]